MVAFYIYTNLIILTLTLGWKSYEFLYGSFLVIIRINLKEVMGILLLDLV